MSSSLPASSLAALAKVGVIRLDAEYKHDGATRVGQMFEGGAAALGRSDFTQPLKVAHTRTHIHTHARMHSVPLPPVVGSEAWTDVLVAPC